MDEARFARLIVDTVAKRAGHICSNPDCQAITTGPADTPDKSVNVGEAAHIYGANPGSARFNELMSPAERSDIANAIWLCRICHKLIDADVPRFPASLIFEWRREHEALIVQRLGKPGEMARQRVLSRELEEFRGCSYRAQQIVIDKPDFWEYKLTTELLRDKMPRVLSQWSALSKGLYTKSTVRIPLDEMMAWHQSKMDELGSIVDAFNGLINSELSASWGPPGTPGSESEILRACSLLADSCQRILDWEESVRFVYVPSEFKAVQSNLIGIGGRMLDKIAVIPKEMANIFEVDSPGGNHKINIVIDLPDGWVERTISAMQAAAQDAFG